MKFTIRQISSGEDEVILKYQRMTPEVERICHFLKEGQIRLIGTSEGTRTMLEPKEIIYIESVDGNTFAYTKEAVYRIDHALNRLEQLLSNISFFRCSKSMILNIDKVMHLKSLPSNRIDATMCNGEHVLISRTYASDFRKRLKGGSNNE